MMMITNMTMRMVIITIITIMSTTTITTTIIRTIITITRRKFPSPTRAALARARVQACRGGVGDGGREVMR